MNANRMIRAGWFFLAILLLVLPVHAQKESSNKKTVAPPAVYAPAKTEVFFCETPTTECRSNAASFEVKRLRDLYVFVTWPKTPGDHVQTVEFYLPDGNAYVKKDTPFRTRAGITRARRPEGTNLPDSFFTASRGIPTVITSLPVAGTYISQRSLTGAWTVRVLLDGQLVTTAQFTLRDAQTN